MKEQILISKLKRYLLIFSLSLLLVITLDIIDISALTCATFSCKPTIDINVCDGGTITCGPCDGILSCVFNREVYCDDGYCGDDERCQCDSPPPPPAQCNDGIDNDGDGLIDHPADPGCSSKLDNNEFNPVDPPPTIDIKCEGTQGPCTVPYGNMVNLSWSSQNAAVCWTGGGTPDWTDDNWDQSAPRNNPTNPGSIEHGPWGGVTSTVTYRIWCQNMFGEINDSVTVNAGPPPLPPAPVVDLDWGGSDGIVSVPFGSLGTLNWTVQESTTSCTASSTAGDFSGSKPFPIGSEGKGPITSSRTYTLTCSGPGGSGNDSVTVNTSAPPPNATPAPADVTVSQPDYCVSGPAALVSWTFTDPDPGSSQSAFQVQVDDQPSFNSPEINTGKVPGSQDSYLTSPTLDWNTTYSARIRVWDNLDAVSNWVTATCTGDCINNFQWKTPIHAYPSNVNYSWTPLKPVINQIVQFTATSICYDSSDNPTSCSTHRWTWGDGTPGLTGSDPTPTHVYTAEGNYTTTYQVSDSAGFTCPVVPMSKNILVQKPIPSWREVLPR